MEIGTMVLISKRARNAGRGKAGWITGFTRGNKFARIELRNDEGTVEANKDHLILASDGFKWPTGVRADLDVYEESHPQRIPTEGYFADSVRRDINDVRHNTGTGYANLWLLIASLKDLEDPQDSNAGFHSWLWAIEGVLGADSCRKIGEVVCRLMNFTVEEGENLTELHRKTEASECGLPETASWEEIREAQWKRMEAAHEVHLAPMPDRSNTEAMYSNLSEDQRWDLLVEKAFASAGLPEVEESQLEPGTYTNAQIAAKLRHDPMRFTALLMQVSDLGSEAEKRSILSVAVDSLDNDGITTE